MTHQIDLFFRINATSFPPLYRSNAATRIFLHLEIHLFFIKLTIHFLSLTVDHGTTPLSCSFLSVMSICSGMTHTHTHTCMLHQRALLPFLSLPLTSLLPFHTQTYTHIHHRFHYKGCCRSSFLLSLMYRLTHFSSFPYTVRVYGVASPLSFPASAGAGIFSLIQVSVA